MKRRALILAALLALGLPAAAEPAAAPPPAPPPGAPPAPPAADSPDAPNLDDAAGWIRTTKTDIRLPPELAAKLSPEQIAEVLADRERTRRELANKSQVEGWLVPIAMFIAVVVAIAIVQLMGNRREALRQKTVQLMVEKGAAIPPELLGKVPRPASDLRRGLVLVGTGAGVALFFAILRVDDTPSGLWSLGLLPAFIGLGYLGAFFFEARRRAVEGR